MPREIERKFLVANDDWKGAVTGRMKIRQAYLVVEDAKTLRIRIKDGETAILGIKLGVSGLSREEFEYEIPLEDAEKLLAARVGRVVDKRRHIVEEGGARWEVDVFAGPLEGLVMAEIELDRENQRFERPAWLGPEVTEDSRYTNARLALGGLPT